MTIAHAKLSASGSKRWMSCPASVQAEQGIPDGGGNIYAAEGTAAHHLAEKCLEHRQPASFYIGECITAGDYSFEVDEDMASAVQVYVDYCNNLPVETRLLEKRVRFDKWVPDGFGTSDFIGIGEFSEKGPARQVIYVVDLKFGKGVMVDALENSQAMLYGLGTLQSLDFLYGFNENDLVVCVIVQPRLDHISEFSITVGDLLRWGDKSVVPAVNDALGENPSYNPGDDQCRWCKAKPTCKALADENFKAVFEDFGVVPTEQLTKPFEKTTLSAPEIGTLLKKIPMIVDWAKSVEAYAFDQLNRGENIPGYKLVHGKRGNKKWNKPDTEVLEFLKNLDMKKADVTKTSLLTPTQVEKVMKKQGETDPTWIKDIWDQPDGKPTIAPEGDKRKPIKAEAERDFTAIK